MTITIDKEEIQELRDLATRLKYVMDTRASHGKGELSEAQRKTFEEIRDKAIDVTYWTLNNIVG